MEFGNTLPEVVTDEDNAFRLARLGEIGIRSYQVLERHKDREDKPIARQFAACELYAADEAKQSMRVDIPGQQILPIEFS